MQFRKLAAVGGAALMAGMSFAAPALAAVTNVADIGNLAGVTDSTAVFPTFYVGADAAPSDVNAAINLAAYLAGGVFTSKTVTVAGAATPSDGVTLRTELGNTTAKTKDFALSGALVVSPPARSGRSASFLKESTLSVGGTEYKYYESIELTSGNAVSSSAGYFLTTGDISSSTTYETGKKDVGLQIGTTNDIKYRLIFDTALPLAANLTGKSLTFLGQTYTITGTPSTTEIKLSPSAGGQFIPYQQSATLSGFTVKVTALGASTDPVGLEVSAGGETKGISLSAGESSTVTVGGQTTTVSVTRVTGTSSGGAEILVGATALKLTHGQEVKDTAGNVVTGFKDWVANIGTSGGALTHINLTYQRSASSFTGDPAALTVGKSITGPNSFFILKNTGPEKRDYVRFVISAVHQQNLDASASTSENGIKVEAKDPTTGSALKIIDAGSAGFVDSIAWDNTNLNWRYLNTSGGWSSLTTTGNQSTVPLPEGTLYFEPRNATAIPYNEATIMAASGDLAFRIVEPPLYVGLPAQGQFWRLEFDDQQTSGQSRFADIAAPLGDTGNTYLSFNNVSLATGTSTGSEIKSRTAFWSNWGSSLVSAGQTSVTIDVPKTENYYDILFGREAGAAGGGSLVTKEPVRLTGDYAKLDTEVADWSKISTNAVVMGGPAVNRAAAQLLGVTYPTHGVASGVPENAALIQVFQNAFSSGKVAVLVAGWEAAETDLAVSAITAGKVTQTAAKVTVSGTVAAPVITAA